MTAEDVKKLLKLSPLEPEGGFFRETYRSRWQVPADYRPGNSSGTRAIGTAIYYLITPDSYSRLHRLPGTEIFHFYLGDPAQMLQLHPDGRSELVTLGQNIVASQQPQVVVRGGVWQGLRLVEEGEWALLGTTMSPGFDYADYENGIWSELVEQFPGEADLIEKYT